MIDMIIYGSLLILTIICVRLFTIKRLPKSMFIVLWLAAILRLIVPFTMPAMINIYPAVNTISEAVEMPVPLQFMYDSAPHNIPDTTEQVISRQTISIEAILMIVWIIGIVVTLLAFILPHIKNIKRYKTALPTTDNEFITAWKLHHPLKRNYRILQSDEIFTPFTYGVINPVIVLPADIIAYDYNCNYNVTDYILTHEYVHICRFDIIKKWLVLAALCIHWFNPLVWVMYVLMNNDIEIACDEKVVKLKGINNKIYYATLLVELASTKPNYNMLVSNFTKSKIKQRVGLIMKTKKTTLRQMITCLLIVSCTLLINVTSYAVVSDEVIPIPYKINKVATEETIDPYAHVRFGEEKNILLLEVEWYTYDSYYEEVYLPALKQRENATDPDEIYYMDYRIETIEKDLQDIKYNKLVKAKSVNGKTSNEVTQWVNIKIINNGKDHYPSYIAGHFDENGYYTFRFEPAIWSSIGYWDENGEVSYFYLYKNAEYFTLDYDKYDDVLTNIVIPEYSKLLERGVISQSFYDSITRSPLEYFTELFF